MGVLSMKSFVSLTFKPEFKCGDTGRKDTHLWLQSAQGRNYKAQTHRGVLKEEGSL